MKKILQCLCFLSVICIGSAYAVHTVVWNLGHPAQCNNWGWVTGNLHTNWNNICSPLQVNYQGNIIQVDTTEVCENNLSSTYQIHYNDRLSKYELVFAGCLQ